MNVLVVGNPDLQAEFNAKFGSEHQINFKTSKSLSQESILTADVVFDFEISPKSTHGKLYQHNSDAILMVNSVLTTRSSLIDAFQWKNSVIGFNGMAGMFGNTLLELTTTSPDAAHAVCSKLGTDYRLVADQVGMVTPRVVCMIINEAYFTVEDGTASEADIDLAMKLGTNYPAGPFEMARTIGIPNICKLLQALLTDTGDSRYEICPMLKSQCS